MQTASDRKINHAKDPLHGCSQTCIIQKLREQSFCRTQFYSPREKKGEFFLKRNIIQILTKPLICSILSEHGTLGKQGKY